MSTLVTPGSSTRTAWSSSSCPVSSPSRTMMRTSSAMSGTILVVAVDKTSARERCTWCGERVERDDGFRLLEEAGGRRAVFCRRGRVAPWSVQGPDWEAGEPQGAAALARGLDECAQCGAALGDVRVVLVRPRGGHRIPDAFCAVGHGVDWAKAGG